MSFLKKLHIIARSAAFNMLLAEDLQWLYSYFTPSTDRNMPPQYYVMISKTGALGLGEFPYRMKSFVEV